MHRPTYAAVLLACTVECQMLLRGRLGGMQLYDPVNTPHATQLTKPSVNTTAAYGGYALMNWRRNAGFFVDDGQSNNIVNANLNYLWQRIFKPKHSFEYTISDGICFMFDVVTHSTRVVMSMQEKRMWFGMTMIHENVVVCGGVANDNWPPPENASHTYNTRAPHTHTHTHNYMFIPTYLRFIPCRCTLCSGVRYSSPTLGCRSRRCQRHCTRKWWSRYMDSPISLVAAWTMAPRPTACTCLRWASGWAGSLAEVVESKSAFVCGRRFFRFVKIGCYMFATRCCHSIWNSCLRVIF